MVSWGPTDLLKAAILEGQKSKVFGSEQRRLEMGVLHQAGVGRLIKATMLVRNEFRAPGGRLCGHV